MAMSNTITVSSGSSVTGTVVSSGHKLNILSGGSAVSAIISKGGKDVVSGSASETTISSGGLEQVYDFSLNAQVLNGGGQIVENNGVASGAVISDGGTQRIVSGGEAISTYILNGGSQRLQDGGGASGTVVSSGGQELVMSGGSATYTDVLAGGVQTVLSAGSAYQTTVSGGNQHVGAGGSAISTVVLNGGSQTVTNGGSAFDTVVGSGGVQYVSSGATAIDTVISSGGMEDITLGSTVTDIVLMTGGAIDVTNEEWYVNGSTYFDSSTDVLSITEASHVETIQLSGNYDGWSFTATKDTTGTLVMVTACYGRGTRILTDRGEVAVEALAIGDRLVTLSGALAPLKWIGRRSYAGWLAEGNPDIQPIRFKAGALGDNQPSRDLLVSPEHAMYVDGALIPAKLLVNGVTIAPAEAMEEVEYFHLELPEHAVIFAEGALSESFVDDDSRGMFHNAHEFHALYPNAPRGGQAEYCAPRVEDGFALEAARQKLMSRAVRLRPDGSVAALPVLTGSLDRVSRYGVEGWAYEPEGPVALAVLDNGVAIGRVIADLYRPDLAAAGIGMGRHGFRLVLRHGFSHSVDHRIEVRRVSDWTLLPGAPATLKADTFAPRSLLPDAVLLAAE
jgi:autotransporter passenger strand-loop-strand repeat protein